MKFSAAAGVLWSKKLNKQGCYCNRQFWVNAVRQQSNPALKLFTSSFLSAALWTIKINDFGVTGVLRTWWERNLHWNFGRSLAGIVLLLSNPWWFCVSCISNKTIWSSVVCQNGISGTQSLECAHGSCYIFWTFVLNGDQNYFPV